jgi:hypothetical protein
MDFKLLSVILFSEGTGYVAENITTVKVNKVCPFLKANQDATHDIGPYIPPVIAVCCFLTFDDAHPKVIEGGNFESVISFKCYCTKIN